MTIIGARSPHQILEGQHDTALAALAAAGIDETRLPAQTWRKVMTYIDLTPRMYRALRDLG